MENAVRLASLTHELIEALGGARKHVSDVPGRKAYALRLSRSARCIDDSDEVGISSRAGAVRNRSSWSNGLLQHFIEGQAPRHRSRVASRCLHGGLAESGITRNQPLGLAVARHGS